MLGGLQIRGTTRGAGRSHEWTINSTSGVGSTTTGATAATDEDRRQQPRPGCLPEAARHAAAAPGSDATRGQQRVHRAAGARSARSRSCTPSRRRSSAISQFLVAQGLVDSAVVHELRNRRAVVMAGSSPPALSGLNANRHRPWCHRQQPREHQHRRRSRRAPSTFQDLVSQTVGGASANPMQVGLGVTTGSISPIVQPGLDREHRRGDQRRHPGQRLLRRRAAPTASAYTRAGNFTLRQRRRARDDRRLHGAGLHADRPGDRRGRHHRASRRDIVVPPGVLRAPTPTTRVHDADEPRTRRPPVGDTFTTSVQMYDPLGVAARR